MYIHAPMLCGCTGVCVHVTALPHVFSRCPSAPSETRPCLACCSSDLGTSMHATNTKNGATPALRTSPFIDGKRRRNRVVLICVFFFDQNPRPPHKQSTRCTTSVPARYSSFALRFRSLFRLLSPTDVIPKRRVLLLAPRPQTGRGGGFPRDLGPKLEGSTSTVLQNPNS